MNICIVVPYPNADQLTPIWSEEQSRIDFRAEPDRAARCTSAFAAMELKRHLERSVCGSSVVFASQPADSGDVIELGIADSASRDDGYELDPIPSGVRIQGSGRAGKAMAP